jgi:hypothetical protein
VPRLDGRAFARTSLAVTGVGHVVRFAAAIGEQLKQKLAARALCLRRRDSASRSPWDLTDAAQRLRRKASPQKEPVSRIRDTRRL